MSLERSQRLTTTDKPVAELPLTPEDFFVLSRVDGRATVGEVIAASGLPAGDAQQILSKLLELGAVTAQAAESPGQGNGPSRSKGASLKSRRAAMLKAQFASATGGAGGQTGRAPAAKAREAESTSAVEAGDPGDPGGETPQKPDGMVRVDPVPADDPRLDPSLDIGVEEQRLLWATEDRLSELSHFEMLGISPTNDKKLIRTAYHLVSRKFHPDRYYNKNIGPLAPLLQQLFKRAKSSLEVLMKDELREAYVERFLAQRRREEAQRRAQVDAKQRAAAARKRAEDEMKALEAQVAAKERAQRDQARKARQQRRVLSANRAKRSDKASDYFEKGQAQRAAGNPGNAANMFRLALDLDPGNDEYESLWKSSLREARVQRAAKAYNQGTRLEDMNRLEQAKRLYVEAAEADPIAPHLGEAAYFLREDDPARARDLAMRALDALGAEGPNGKGLSMGRRGRVLFCAAHAFLAAGQVHSARQQALAARELLGDRPDVRALLNSVKKA